MEQPHETSAAEDRNDWQKNVDDLNDKTQKLIREEPAKAVGIALFIGALLTILPIGRILSALVRLAFSLIRPLLFVFGAVKLYEQFDKKQKL